MIRSIFWKEWRENRWKYAAYWLVLNIPILLAVLAVALSTGARFPFADLSDATAPKYLGVALVAESFFIATIFLFATGFLAVSSFRPELEDGSVFFVFEQPLPRWRYLAMKLLNGISHTILAVVFAVLFAPAAALLPMLIGGKVTIVGSSATLATVFAAAARASFWCALISIAIFAGCALVSALMPRWWMAATGSIVLIVALLYVGGNFFDFVAPAFESAQNLSIGLGFGSPQWLTVTGPLPLSGFARFRAVPLLLALLLTAVFSVGTALLYNRKELK